LAEDIGLFVAITNKGEKGELKIRYNSLEQLELLCAKLRA
jgi:hypothetical protein